MSTSSPSICDSQKDNCRVLRIDSRRWWRTISPHWRSGRIRKLRNEFPCNGWETSGVASVRCRLSWFVNWRGINSVASADKRKGPAELSIFKGDIDWALAPIPRLLRWWCGLSEHRRKGDSSEGALGLRESRGIKRPSVFLSRRGNLRRSRSYWFPWID